MTCAGRIENCCADVVCRQVVIPTPIIKITCRKKVFVLLMIVYLMVSTAEPNAPVIPDAVAPERGPSTFKPSDFRYLANSR